MNVLRDYTGDHGVLPQWTARKSAIVFKLGGSLLDLPDLVTRLRRVLCIRPDRFPILVVGGGMVTDVVRHWSTVFQLTDANSHDLAIDSLDLTAQLIQVLMPEFLLVRSHRQLELAMETNRPALVCIKCFMKWLDTRSNHLPHNWSVTSDSIAAAVAIEWGADELVLLKSIDVNPDTSFNDWATEGLVDPCFPKLAPQLNHVSIINLRK